VLKVQHKPIKRYKLGFKRKEQKKSKRTLVWRTGLSGVQPDSVRCTRDRTGWTPHLRVSEAALRYNSQAELPSGATVASATVDSNGRLTTWTVRRQFAQSQSNARRCTGQWTVLVRCDTGLSGAPSCQSSNGRNCQNPNDWVTWLAHRTVWCAHRQQPSPTAVLVVGAINTPQPPLFKASKFPAYCIQYKSSRLNSKTQTRDQILSKVQNHSKHLVTCERDIFVFIWVLVAWIAFFFLHSCSQDTCNQSKRHQVVVVLVRGLSDPFD
jgi:hypothetical protein